MPLISVIVPVYKAETYLHRCVDSLLIQTFRDFEILLIDDGSPDHSGEICDEYAKKDKRVRVFHKENGGVSSARQYGIDNALGEYTIHADPDDWAEPTMLEELYRKAKDDDADMVICDFYEERKERTIYVYQQPSSLDCKTVLCELFQQLYGSCWNKLVRRSCYTQYNIRFPLELSFCEDLYVNAYLLSCSVKRITYLSKAFYHYDLIINANSLIKKSGKFILSQTKIFCSLLQKILLQENLYDIYPYVLYNQAFIILSGSNENLSTFYKDFSELRDLMGKTTILRKKKVLIWIAFYISPYLAHFLYKIWIYIRIHTK